MSATEWTIEGYFYWPVFDWWGHPRLPWKIIETSTGETVRGKDGYPIRCSEDRAMTTAMRLDARARRKAERALNKGANLEAAVESGYGITRKGYSAKEGA